jgi:hypothetical protein
MGTGQTAESVKGIIIIIIIRIIKAVIIKSQLAETKDK